MKPFFSALLFFAFLPMFVQGWAQCTAVGSSLVTQYASDNSNKGVMFDVTATNTVTITCLDVNFIGYSTGDFEIYYKAGTFLGFTQNAAAWTQIGTVSVTGRGINNVTPIPMLLDIVIPAGQTYGFYVTNNDAGIPAGVRYTNGAGNHLTLGSDANITIQGGIGKAYPFDADYNNRSFNGTVHYQLGNNPLGSLPVELTDFEAISTPSGVILNWATGQETNNAYFTLERSANAAAWEDIQQIPGAGNSDHPLAYSFTDHTPLPGTSYYRLSQTDTDGQRRFFTIQTTTIETSSVLQSKLYPNPATESVTIHTLAGAHISVYDALGRRVITQQLSEQETAATLSLEALDAGVYQVEILASGQRKVQSLIRLSPF